jgi:hypothetical protein
VAPHTIVPEGLFGVMGTTWNAVYIEDAWADFGVLGTISAPVAVGILLQGYNVWFARSRRTAFHTATFWSAQRERCETRCGGSAHCSTNL